MYRRSFRASPVLDEPHVIVTANVLVAPSDEEAAWEAAPGRLMVLGIRTGRFEPLVSPETAANHPDLSAALAMPSNRIVGSPSTAVEALDALVQATGADEIMVSSVAHSLESRLRNLELLASAWAEAPE
jgi:alkanesulfonate monooxygenase SsuD/methylene tetrahydromethanopterin reductase-like flavin-dependent oxidoreductase (luciferase family)